jgi:hypothetical protein
MNKTRKNRESKSRRRRTHRHQKQSRRQTRGGGLWAWLTGNKDPSPQDASSPPTDMKQNPLVKDPTKQTTATSTGSTVNPSNLSAQPTVGGKRKRRTPRCKK